MSWDWVPSIVHDTTCDRLDAAAREALERTRATLTPHVPPGYEDADVLRALIGAAPELDRLLRPFTTGACLSTALRHALERAADGAHEGLEGAPAATLDSLVVQAAQVADEFIQDEVTPAHLLMALLAHPSDTSTSCLREIGLSLPTTLDAIGAHLRGGSRPW